MLLVFVMKSGEKLINFVPLVRIFGLYMPSVANLHVSGKKRVDLSALYFMLHSIYLNGALTMKKLSVLAIAALMTVPSVTLAGNPVPAEPEVVMPPASSSAGSFGSLGGGAAVAAGVAAIAAIAVLADDDSSNDSATDS